MLNIHKHVFSTFHKLIIAQSEVCGNISDSLLVSRKNATVLILGSKIRYISYSVRSK